MAKMENLESNDGKAVDVGLRANQLAALSHHLLELAEAEKASLARELHDELGACLTVISLDISIVAEKLRQTEPELVTKLDRAITRIKEAVALKRRLIEGLRPSMLDSLGLSACLTEHALEFERRTGLPVITEFSQKFDNMDANAAICLYRIAEESLLNIEKHAGARHVWMTLQEHNGGAHLLIEDDGVGIASDAAAAPESVGLISMRERMIARNGTFAAHRRHAGSGTTVEAWLPAPL